MKHSPANVRKRSVNVLVYREILVNNPAQDSTENSIQDDVSRVQIGLSQIKLLSTEQTIWNL